MITKFDTMTDADVDRRLHTAHARLTRRRTDLAERIELLQRIADRHRKQSDELARVMTLEIGKPISQAKGEVALAASIYVYYASKGEALLAEEVLEIAGTGSAVAY
jgi:succinate-semialdehyde dehydrogenase/glutarate-semialdehyde dehydrogenase